MDRKQTAATPTQTGWPTGTYKPFLINHCSQMIVGLEKVVGQVGQADVASRYDVDQTLRTYVDCATVGADNDDAFHR